MLKTPGVILKIVIFLYSLLWISCNAPRTNPLDPFAPDDELVRIEGSVQTFSLPFTGIPDVLVFWEPANILVKTNNSGEFFISKIKPVDGLLIFQKEGYNTDTLMIVWDNTKMINPEINLNKIPKLENFVIYSHIMGRSNQELKSELIIDAKITDEDNDIDSVYIKNEEFNFQKGLDFNITKKAYETTISTTELNISNIEQSVGSGFKLWVYSSFNNKNYNVGENKIVRIINMGAEIISPANDTLSTPLELQWTQFSAGFMFHYKVEVYNDIVADPQLVFSEDKISQYQTNISLVDTNINSGDYYWVVWVIDQYKNGYRSQPGRFHIE